MSDIELASFEKRDNYLLHSYTDKYKNYLRNNLVHNNYCKNIILDTKDINEYYLCFSEILSNLIIKPHRKIDLILPYLSFTSNIFKIHNILHERKSDAIPKIIEAPLKSLYLLISDYVEGLFYHIQKVQGRKSDNIINILVIILKKDYEIESKIYEELGMMMKEYPDQLFDFSILRRNGQDIREISKGYDGYVYP